MVVVVVVWLVCAALAGVSASVTVTDHTVLCRRRLNRGCAGQGFPDARGEERRGEDGGVVG